MNGFSGWPAQVFLALVLVFAGLAYLQVAATTLADGNPQLAGFLSAASGAFTLFTFAGLAVAIGAAATGRGKLIGIEQGAGATWHFAVGFIGAAAFYFATQALPQTQAVLSVPVAGVFSSAAGGLPAFWGAFLVAVAAPIAEELFFSIAVPALLILALDALGSSVRMALLRNNYFKLAVVLVVTPLLFALFHLSQAGSNTFLLASIAFRSVIIAAVYLDAFANILPFATVGLGAAIGLHMSNNIAATGGLPKFLGVMLTGAGDTI